MISANILRLISIEMELQQRKFGKEPLATKFQAASVLTEEVGKYCRAVNQNNLSVAEQELIQVIAISIRILQGDFIMENKYENNL